MPAILSPNIRRCQAPALALCSDFAGTLLTAQLPTQTALSAFFLLMDAILIAQYVQFRRRKINNVLLAPVGAAVGSVAVVSSAYAPTASAATAATAAPPPVPQLAGTTLLCSRSTQRIQLPLSPSAAMGLVLGCIGLALYVLGGWFQVVKNARRQSTRGLSALNQQLLLLMNVLYLVSVLLRLASAVDFGASAPWILGVTCSGIIKVAILWQIRRYRQKESYGEAADEGEASSIAGSMSSTHR